MVIYRICRLIGKSNIFINFADIFLCLVIQLPYSFLVHRVEQSGEMYDSNKDQDSAEVSMQT